MSAPDFVRKYIPLRELRTRILKFPGSRQRDPINPDIDHSEVLPRITRMGTNGKRGHEHRKRSAQKETEPNCLAKQRGGSGS